MTATETPPPKTPLADRSLGELVATLSRDLALLVHQEIELVKAELRAGLVKVAVGVGVLAGAVVLLLLAVPLLTIAAALGVHALGISLGWSFLIIAGAFVLLGALVGFIGVRHLRQAKPPTQAITSVKADLHTFARKPKSGSDAGGN